MAITYSSFPKARCPRTAPCCPSAPASDCSPANRRPRILPVALQGLGELKQRKRRWFRSHTLQIRVGKTIEPATQLAPEELAELLHHALAGLLQRER